MCWRLSVGLYNEFLAQHNYEVNFHIMGMQVLCVVMLRDVGGTFLQSVGNQYP